MLPIPLHLVYSKIRQVHQIILHKYLGYLIAEFIFSVTQITPYRF